MAKASKEIKKGENFTPLAHKYQSPFGPKPKASQIAGKIMK